MSSGPPALEPTERIQLKLFGAGASPPTIPTIVTDTASLSVVLNAYYSSNDNASEQQPARLLIRHGSRPLLSIAEHDDGVGQQRRTRLDSMASVLELSGGAGGDLRVGPGASVSTSASLDVGGSACVRGDLSTSGAVSALGGYVDLVDDFRSSSLIFPPTANALRAAYVELCNLATTLRPPPPCEGGGGGGGTVGIATDGGATLRVQSLDVCGHVTAHSYCNLVQDYLSPSATRPPSAAALRAAYVHLSNYTAIQVRNAQRQQQLSCDGGSQATPPPCAGVPTDVWVWPGGEDSVIPTDRVGGRMFLPSVDEACSGVPPTAWATPVSGDEDDNCPAFVWYGVDPDSAPEAPQRLPLLTLTQQGDVAVSRSLAVSGGASVEGSVVVAGTLRVSGGIVEGLPTATRTVPGLVRLVSDAADDDSAAVTASALRGVRDEAHERIEQTRDMVGSAAFSASRALAYAAEARSNSEAVAIDLARLQDELAGHEAGHETATPPATPLVLTELEGRGRVVPALVARTTDRKTAAGSGTSVVLGDSAIEETVRGLDVGSPGLLTLRGGAISIPITPQPEGLGLAVGGDGPSTMRLPPSDAPDGVSAWHDVGTGLSFSIRASSSADSAYVARNAFDRLSPRGWVSALSTYSASTGLATDLAARTEVIVSPQSADRKVVVAGEWLQLDVSPTGALVERLRLTADDGGDAAPDAVVVLGSEAVEGPWNIVAQPPPLAYAREYREDSTSSSTRVAVVPIAVEWRTTLLVSLRVVVLKVRDTSAQLGVLACPVRIRHAEFESSVADTAGEFAAVGRRRALTVGDGALVVDRSGRVGAGLGPSDGAVPEAALHVQSADDEAALVLLRQGERTARVRVSESEALSIEAVGGLSVRVRGTDTELLRARPRTGTPGAVDASIGVPTGAPARAALHVHDPAPRAGATVLVSGPGGIEVEGGGDIATREGALVGGGGRLRLERDGGAEAARLEVRRFTADPPSSEAEPVVPPPPAGLDFVVEEEPQHQLTTMRREGTTGRMGDLSSLTAGLVWGPDGEPSARALGDADGLDLFRSQSFRATWTAETTTAPSPADVVVSASELPVHVTVGGSTTRYVGGVVERAGGPPAPDALVPSTVMLESASTETVIDLYDHFLDDLAEWCGVGGPGSLVFSVVSASDEALLPASHRPPPGDTSGALRLQGDFRGRSSEVTISAVSAWTGKQTVATLTVVEPPPPRPLLLKALGSVQLLGLGATASIDLGVHFSDSTGTGAPLVYDTDRPDVAVFVAAPGGAFALQLLGNLRGSSGYPVTVTARSSRYPDGEPAASTLTVTEVDPVTPSGASRLGDVELRDNRTAVTFVLSATDGSPYFEDATLGGGIEFAIEQPPPLEPSPLEPSPVAAALAVHADPSVSRSLAIEAIEARTWSRFDALRPGAYDAVVGTAQPLDLAARPTPSELGTTRTTAPTVYASRRGDAGGLHLTLALLGDYRDATYEVALVATSATHPFVSARQVVRVTEPRAPAPRLVRAVIEGVVAADPTTPTRVELRGAFEDAAGRGLSYSILDDPSSNATIESTSLVLVAAHRGAGEYTVRVRATSEPYGVPSDEALSVVVTETDPPPVARPGVEGSTVLTIASSSVQPARASLAPLVGLQGGGSSSSSSSSAAAAGSLSFEVVASPYDAVYVDGADLVATGARIFVSGRELYPVTIRARDTFGQSCEFSVAIRVVPPPTAALGPVVNLGPQNSYQTNPAWLFAGGQPPVRFAVQTAAQQGCDCSSSANAKPPVIDARTGNLVPGDAPPHKPVPLEFGAIVTATDAFGQRGFVRVTVS